MKRWLANHAHLGVRRLIAALLVIGIVVGSIAIAALVALKYENDHVAEQRSDLRRVAIALDSVSSQLIGQLASTATFMNLRPDLDEGEFRRVIDSLGSGSPMVAVAYLEGSRRALGSVPGRVPRRVGGPEPVLREGGLAFAVRLRSGAAEEGLLRPANALHGEYLVDALDRARDSAMAAISRAVRLQGNDDRHLVIFYPVSPPRPDSDRSAAGLRRFVAGVVNIPELLKAAAVAVPGGTGIALANADGEIFRAEDRSLEGYSATPVVIADRRWDLRLATPQSQVWALPLIVGLAGLILAGAIGLLLLNWSRRERGVIDLARTRLAERDRAMRAEAETNRMYRLLAENLSDMVMVVTPAGTISYVSPAGERMLGYAAEEMVDRPILDFLHSDDQAEAVRHLAALREGADVHTFEHRLQCADGSFIWVESAVRSVFDPNSGKVLELQSATRDISERKPLQEQLERLAREDPLTGLSNRRQLNEMLAAELARAARSGESCAVMLIDVDHFKQVNDSYGHLAGDRVLRRLAEALRSRVRRSDTVARLGGDEFAAILPDAGAAQAEPIADQVMEAVKEALADDPDLPGVTVSIGIAIFEGESGITGEHLLERADLALYAAKAAGRERVEIYAKDRGLAGPRQT